MNTVNQNLQAAQLLNAPVAGKATPTGRHRCHSITGERAAVYAVEMGSPIARDGWADGDVIALADGSSAYVFEDAGEWGLYRDAVARDYGANEIGRRTAPASTWGVGVAFATPTRTYGDGLVGWVDG